MLCKFCLLMIYIYIFDPKLHRFTAEHSKRGSHGPFGKVVNYLQNILDLILLLSSFYWGFIEVFSDFIVGNIFRHILHAICSLVIWYLNLLLSSSFSLKLSHLYTFVPFSMWNLLSRFNRLDVLLNSFLPSISSRGGNP